MAKLKLAFVEMQEETLPEQFLEWLKEGKVILVSKALTCTRWIIIRRKSNQIYIYFSKDCIVYRRQDVTSVVFAPALQKVWDYMHNRVTPPCNLPVVLATYVDTYLQNFGSIYSVPQIEYDLATKLPDSFKS